MPISHPKRGIAILIAVLVVAVGLFVLYTWMSLSFAYSEGDRAGYLQKFSRKGWLCKTWEGEMLLSSMPGAIPERFNFSVRDPAVVTQMEAAVGKRMQMTYSEHRGVPTECFGETSVFATKVKLLP
jgi:hypothetical protein